MLHHVIRSCHLLLLPQCRLRHFSDRPVAHGSSTLWLAKILSTILLSLSPSAAAARLSLLRPTLKMFDEMSTSSLIDYLVNLYIETDRIDISKALLTRAPDFGCVVRTHTVNILMSRLFGSNLVQDAIFFFEKLLYFQVFTADTWSFSIIIRGLCRSGKIQRAFDFLHKMRYLGCSPDVVTHNIIIDALCKDKQVDRARDFLQEIQSSSSCRPNVITYTSLISGYRKLGRMGDALKVFDEMLGSGIKPSRFTYNVLIDGHVKEGDMPLAISVYERMLACSCSPDVVTVTSLIDGFCRNGQLDDAVKLWNEMGKNKMQPNAYAYAIVINALCKNSRLNEARIILKEMNVRSDIKPGAFVYNPVIDGLCKAGDVEGANSVLMEMKSKECSPDKYTYTILMLGHFRKGNIVEAIDLFDKMVDAGRTVDSVTVGSLVSFLLKTGIPDEVDRHMLTSKRPLFGVDGSNKGTSSVLTKNLHISLSAYLKELYSRKKCKG